MLRKIKESCPGALGQHVRNLIDTLNKLYYNKTQHFQERRYRSKKNNVIGAER